MRVIIAGTRRFQNYAVLEQAVASCQAMLRWSFEEIVSGREPTGVDRLGEEYAFNHGIPVKPFPAKWRLPDGTTDRGAGHKRNYQMALYADALIALWDGRSPGTKNMIDTMRKTLRKPAFVWRIDAGFVPPC
jgi:hypothetical protein